ncbi:MAG: Na+/H+ antiporter subunit E [Clostridia bacterium]|nr:Na+/H+ antiporter subunit E [Clostridia bacterium]
MLVVLFTFWLLLNGKWTVEIGLVGFALALLIDLFAWKYMGYSPKRSAAFIRRLPRALAYAVWLVGAVIRAAFATIRLIWSPRLIAEPRLTSFRTRLKSRTARVMLGNSITLTPGTITVDIREDAFLVHCLDTDFAQGLEDSEMERRLLAVEDPGKEGEPHDA